MRDCTGKTAKDIFDQYLVLKGSLGNTFVKTTPRYVWHTGIGRWQHIRGVSGTYEMDFALEPFVAALRLPK